MIKLSTGYQQQMQNLLGKEYPSFLCSYQESASKSLRINPLKISPESFLAKQLFDLQPIPWCPEGFYYNPKQDRPGKHVYHAAGLYYIQDASAMAPVEALDPQPGEKILDLCAAPGGKTTQIAAKMNNQGLLLANEVDQKRGNALVENLERLGVTNSIVLQALPEQLQTRFPHFFDRILIDAPCSGEGMFRKDRDARERWSRRLVEKCHPLQSSILQSAAKMLRSGGRLVYSTCTFNPWENEAVIEQFLQQHPDFQLKKLPQAQLYQPGRPDWLPSANHPLELTARLWPHQLRGEGHFVAVIEKKETDHTHQPRKTPKKKYISSSVVEYIQNFVQQTLNNINMNRDNLVLFGEHLYLTNPALPPLEQLRVIRPGQYLGQVKRSHFHPSHAWALALAPKQVQRVINFAHNDPGLHAYLQGETLPVDVGSGWTIVTVDHHSLGWGKTVQGMLKNHYPKWLRWEKIAR